MTPAEGGVQIALHGDVHGMRRDDIGYHNEIHIAGAGSFGAVHGQGGSGSTALQCA